MRNHALNLRNKGGTYAKHLEELAPSRIGKLLLSSFAQVNAEIVAGAVERLLPQARRVNSLRNVLRTIAHHDRMFGTSFGPALELVPSEIESVTSEASPAFEELEGVLKFSGVSKVIDEHAREILEEASYEDLPEFEHDLLMRAGYGSEVVPKAVEKAKNHLQRVSEILPTEQLAETRRRMQSAAAKLRESAKKEPGPRFRLERGMVKAVGEAIAVGF